MQKMQIYPEMNIQMREFVLNSSYNYEPKNNQLKLQRAIKQFQINKNNIFNVIIQDHIDCDEETVFYTFKEIPTPSLTGTIKDYYYYKPVGYYNIYKSCNKDDDGVINSFYINPTQIDLLNWIYRSKKAELTGVELEELNTFISEIDPEENVKTKLLYMYIKFLLLPEDVDADGNIIDKSLSMYPTIESINEYEDIFDFYLITQVMNKINSKLYQKGS